MKLVLTDKTTAQEVVIDSDHITLFEPEMDSIAVPAVPTGKTHLLFSNGNGRIVQESPASIAAAVGTFNIQLSKAANVASVSKGVSPKKK